MSDNGVTDPSERTKYKAQVYDLALNAFFKLGEFDSDSLQLSRAEVGWDIAEAFVAAAVSGVTYKAPARTVGSRLRAFFEPLRTRSKKMAWPTWSGAIKAGSTPGTPGGPTSVPPPASLSSIGAPTR